MKIKVSLSEKDIKNGEHRSYSKCPYGLVLKRLFPKCQIHLEWCGPKIEECNATITNKTTILKFNLPDKFAKELYKWEYEGGKLSPGTFEIEL